VGTRWMVGVWYLLPAALTSTATALHRIVSASPSLSHMPPPGGAVTAYVAAHGGLLAFGLLLAGAGCWTMSARREKTGRRPRRVLMGTDLVWGVVLLATCCFFIAVLLQMIAIADPVAR
jgi:hypothetical protein